jgi:hypothetical protein
MALAQLIPTIFDFFAWGLIIPTPILDQNDTSEELPVLP